MHYCSYSCHNKYLKGALDRLVNTRANEKDWREPSGSMRTKQFLNITEPAFGNTRQENECFLVQKSFHPNIQKIRLKERFKKISTKKKNFSAMEGGVEKVGVQNTLWFSSPRQFIIEIEFLMQHLVNSFCSVNVLIHYIEKL